MLATRLFPLCLLLLTFPLHAAEPAPTFPKDGVAFLKTHCVSCHGATKPKADLSLTPFTDDASVLRDRKKWQRVLDVVKSGEMPPKKPKPTVQEVDRFLAVVNGVFQHADRNAKPDPGRVTMRRLNKVEYNNTVRDLTGIDFTPADDFPSDDVGHGFDNIGDVLTLSPVLMERYLAAAESIVDKAIAPAAPRVPTRGVGIQFTEPAARTIPLRKGWRVVTAKPDGTPVETGPVHTPFKVPADGEYVLRFKLYVESESKQPVKVAALVCCDKAAPGVATDAEAERIGGAAAKGLRPFVIAKTGVVMARTEKDAETVTVKIPANLGLHRVAVALMKTTTGEPPPTLFLLYMSLEGPLDTRPASHRKLLACDATKP